MIHGGVRQAAIDTTSSVALTFAVMVLLCRLAKHMVLYDILCDIGKLTVTICNRETCDPQTADGSAEVQLFIMLTLYLS